MYHLSGMVAAPRIKVGADVLPWWPMRGVYLLVERGEAPATGLTEVPGVGGAWWGTGIPVDPSLASAAPGAQITYCFLDDDPVATAGRLRPALEKRWADGTTDHCSPPPSSPSNRTRRGATCPEHSASRRLDAPQLVDHGTPHLFEPPGGLRLGRSGHDGMDPHGGELLGLPQQRVRTGIVRDHG